MTSHDDRPTILAVCDDPEVMRRIEGRLRTRYEPENDVVAVVVCDGSGEAGDELALADQRLPGAFVVGDVSRGSVKRVASVVEEGSIAVIPVRECLRRKERPEKGMSLVYSEPAPRTGHRGSSARTRPRRSS